MTVSLVEVALAAHSRQAPLPAESAGYLVLAVADQVALAARVVRKEAIELNEDGSVKLSAAEPATEGQAEQQLRSLLAELLQAASSLTPALVRVSSKPPLANLAALVAELEAALIPVNRGAARRALARLSRETARAREHGLLAPVPEPEALPPPAPVRKEPEFVAPAPVSAMPIAVAPEPVEELAIAVEVVVEPTPEPLVETRPEPLARRSSSRPPALPPSTPPEPLGRTPRIGTFMSPSVVRQDPADVTDPMPSVEEVEVSLDEVEAIEPEPVAVAEPSAPTASAAPELEALSAPVQALEPMVETLPLPVPEPMSEQVLEAPPLSEPEPTSEPELAALPLPVPEPELEPDPVPRIPRPREPKRSELGSLLKAFGSEVGPSEPELRRELKKIAGVELTPSPAVTSDP